MEQVKYRPSYTREEYFAVKRNPIRIICFAGDPSNLGGILRTAESFLVDEVYISTNPRYSVSSGAERWQIYTKYDSEEELIRELAILRMTGWSPVALEITDQSQVLDSFKFPSKIVFVVGNESTGVPQKALDLCVGAVKIPQYGFTGSLNVTIATSIALYEWDRQWRRT